MSHGASEARERGRLKIYIGSAAGVGKTFRMLSEAHELRRRGVDVVVGFVETHGRAETDALLPDLEVVARRTIEYRTVTLEEMDLDAIVARAPRVAIVDELAHTNVPGTRHRKRWQDAMELLDAGIDVISAVNVQHLESLNDVIASTLGVTVRETIPDWVVANADQVINLDLSAEDLRERLREGRIYSAEKVDSALRNFFTHENLTTLRELALREVASTVDRTREAIVQRESGAVPRTRAVDRIMVAMSSSPPYTAALIRKASRIAGRLNSDWYCVYVQTPGERPDRIDSAVQRTLVDNIQLAQSMGAEVVKLEGAEVASTLCAFAREHGVTLLIVGQSRRSGLRHMLRGSLVKQLVSNHQGMDILVVSVGAATATQGRRVERDVAPAHIRSRADELEKTESVVEAMARSRDSAALMATVANDVAMRLEEVRLPLHILLENRFGELNENQEEMLGAARAAADAADSEIVAMRELGDLDRGARTLRRDRILPGDLVKSLVPTLQALADKRGVTLRVDIEPLVPAIWADEPHLQGALATLLGDAVDGAKNSELEVRLENGSAGCILTMREVNDVPSTVRTVLAVRLVVAMGGVVERSRGELRITLCRQ